MGGVSKLLLPQPFFDKLQGAVIVIGKIVVLVLLEHSLHNLKKLPLAGIVDLPDFGLDLMEPHFYGVELRRIGWQVHHVHIPFLSQLHRLFLVVDGAVVHNQPLLSVWVLLQLIQLFEKFFDEIKVLVLSVGTFDDAPVSESVFADDGNEGEALAFGNGAVDSNFLVGPGPSLFPGHVEVEA